ncbi:serine/threonine-protein kinase [Nannocystis pusilla]|uniref:Serine/threonine-protein kinase n=1 Tax=Nannocystis pusilla TaxID=889268 RepID=A0A9X3J0Z1_9BACT|nr:serine/threonine-protein kinase [Nannocystis pusilla]
MLQIAAALEAAHAQGIIHRDMKPENCFRIRRGNDPDFMKVLDFGIAKVLEDSDVERPSSAASGLLGTPEYVAPELIRGLKPDARVDIYAVGVMFYDLLVGKLPFAGESFMSTLTAHLMQVPPPPSQAKPDAQIPEAVDTVVLRALAKDRDQRYDTIGEFAAALRAAIAEADAALVPPPLPLPPPPEPEPAGIRPRVALAAGAAILLVFSAVLWTMAKRFYTKEQVTPPAATAPVIAAAPAVAPAQPAINEAPKLATPPVVAIDEPPPVAAPPPEPVKSPEPPVEAPVEAAGETTSAAEADTSTEAEPEPAVRSAAPKSPKSGPAALTAGEFASAMSKIGARVKLECSRFSLRKMEVTVQVVVGPDGAVKSAAPTGSQEGSTLGNCVARVVKTALLRPTRAKSTHRHTFTM